MKFKVITLYVLARKLVVGAVTESVRIVVRCYDEQSVVQLASFIQLVHQEFQGLVQLHLGCHICDGLVRIITALKRSLRILPVDETHILVLIVVWQMAGEAHKIHVELVVLNKILIHGFHTFQV